MLATKYSTLSFHSLLHNNVQCLLQEEEEALLLLLQHAINFLQTYDYGTTFHRKINHFLCTSVRGAEDIKP